MSMLRNLPAEGEWLTVLPDYQRRIIDTFLAAGDPLMAAEAWLKASGPQDTAPFGAGVGAGRVNIFLLHLMRELHKLLCTDEGYTEERAEVGNAAKLGKSAFVAAIATGLAPHVGVAAVILSPAIVLIMSVFYNAAMSSGCEMLSRSISDLEPSVDLL